MNDFGPAAILGLCVGFLWGTGCSLAVVYSVYLGGYRKAVRDSLVQPTPKRFRESLKRVEERRAQSAAAAANK